MADLEKSFEKNLSSISGLQNQIAEYKRDFKELRDKVKYLLKQLNTNREFHALVSHTLLSNSRWSIREEINFLLQTVSEVLGTTQNTELKELREANEGLIRK